MAKVNDNLMLRGVSGTIGKDFVVRQMKDGRTLLSVKPDFSRRVFSEGQLTHQSRFQQAAAYAREAAKSNAVYAELARGTSKTAYNLALSDWFHGPVIHRVLRQEGVVHVEASDNVKVYQVIVKVLDAEGNVTARVEGVRNEEGKASHDGSSLGDRGWWSCVLQAEGRVQVEVWDLAGNGVTDG